MWYVVGAILATVATWLWWRWTSVGRGKRARDERILKVLDPIGLRFASQQDVSASEIAELATIPQNRPLLYALLKHYERLDLFPRECADVESQGRGLLAYWMMHPNELQDPPAEMQLVERLARRIEDADAEFLVFRYKMPEGHWAAKNGWILGLSGPFVEGEPPYSGLASAFSRCGDQFGKVQPAELVDWFVAMALRRGA